RSEGDLGEVERQAFHRDPVRTRALLIARDAAVGELDLEVGLDLVLGGCRPLDVDLVFEGAGYRVLEDLRRGLVEVLADVNLLDLRVRTLAGLAASAGRRVSTDTQRGAEQLDPLLEAG